MTTILNASTSAGLIITPDTSGNIQLQYNGVAAPAFSAYSTAAQTGVAGATWTKVLFDTEDFDTNNNFASSRFTPTVAGYYQLNACSDLNPSSGSPQAYGLYKNGTRIKRGTGSYTYISENYCNVSSVVYANGTTDYFEIYCYMQSGGQVYSGQADCYFNGILIRGA